MAEQHRMLLVDGSDATRKMVGQLLRKIIPELQIDCFNRADDALQACNTQQYDLISTSVALPDMDGLDLARRIRMTPKHTDVPVVVISGDSSARDKAHGSEAITDFFDKSQGIKELTNFIKLRWEQRKASLLNSAAASKHRVLYVEDSATAAAAMRKIIQAHGYEFIHTMTAEDGQHLLEKNIREGRMFDLLICDMFLPGNMNGPDLVYQVRNKLNLSSRKLPVVMVTVEGQELSDGNNILNMGANGIITKPIDEKRVAHALEQWLH